MRGKVLDSTSKINGIHTCFVYVPEATINNEIYFTNT